MRKTGAALLIFLCFSCGTRTANSRYEFSGAMPRDVLENYLSKAVTFYGLYDGGSGNLEDNIRFIENTGAKFIGRSLFFWGGEDELEWKIAAGASAAETIHSIDPEIILQAGIFEIVTEKVKRIPIPGWVFRAYGLQYEPRNFQYEMMLYPSGGEEAWTERDYWAPGCSVPDMSRLETRMWFLYLAGRFIDAGYEAIHFGQINIMDDNDPGHIHWMTMLSAVRTYALKDARRHFVLCDAHVWDGGADGGVENGILLFDFFSFPLRIAEIPGNPEEGQLLMGYEDSIYGRSAGGRTPSGWICDNLPYLAEFDNWGSSGREGEDIGPPWIWGYDEISWFAAQPESYRNEWLRYAWNWLRAHDGNGFLQMPGSRCLSPSGWYFACTADARNPGGSNQEETIKSIWQGD